jgi:hypothetical protein
VVGKVDYPARLVALALIAATSPTACQSFTRIIVDPCYAVGRELPVLDFHRAKRQWLTWQRSASHSWDEDERHDREQNQQSLH